MSRDTSNSADLIDVRDIIARVEELEGERDDYEELGPLVELLTDLRGHGGDEKWRGDWYPGLLVRDSYFEDHAREEAKSCGLIKESDAWPARCIDWAEAASELQQDYSTVEYDGVTYWYR